MHRQQRIYIDHRDHLQSTTDPHRPFTDPRRLSTHPHRPTTDPQRPLQIHTNTPDHPKIHTDPPRLPLIPTDPIKADSLSEATHQSEGSQ